MRFLITALAISAICLTHAAAPVAAQTPAVGRAPAMPALQARKDGAAEQLSKHVWVIRGNPNIAIVVGSKATLVVDTGLGAEIGRSVARTASKLSMGRTLYLTTTHFHPEHAAGEGGFPAGTILIRARVQQDELEADNGKVLEIFRRRGESALEGFHYRKPDRLFDKLETLDLGGVHARLIYAGPAHTRGDEQIFVEEDSVLVTGDVVQSKTGPNLAAEGVGPRAWIATVEALRPLKPKLIIPDHSDPGPGVPMIEAEIDFLKTLDDRALALRAQGMPVDQAGATITAELKAKYPDWNIRNLRGAVARAYAE